MPEIDFTIFRNNLKKARHIKELSAKELSVACGLRQQKRVSDIEDGRGKPTIEEVHALCKELGQTVDCMLYHKGTMKLSFFGI